MKKRTRRDFCAALCLLAAFVLWTAALCHVDVQAIGPRGSTVGFAAMNRFFHEITGVNMALYTITDWLGLVPVGFAVGFALLGLAQWIRRRRLLSVDISILLLGAFYLAVMALYMLFEMCVVNYRPVLIDGVLEASYPSSTTLLALCVMPAAIIQLNARIANCILRRCAGWAIVVFCVFMVAGRLVSGVHWLTDVIGGGLLSAGLVLLYRAFCGMYEKTDL